MNRNIITSRYLYLSQALQKGKAGEHLVCAELILQGYNAFLADAGQNYDVLVDVGQMIRVQVRSSSKRFFNNVYRFRLREGKRSERCKNVRDTDCYAFVALDTREIAFVPALLLTKGSEKVVSLVEIKTGTSKGRTFSLFSKFNHKEILSGETKDAINTYRTKLVLLHSNHVTGEAHFNSKMTTSQVNEMKEIFATGKHTQADIARRYNVSQSCIHSILSGKNRLNG